LTDTFSFEKRKVPAHMAHFIDKDVFAASHIVWKDQWDATSGSQLRTSKDLQFALAYFYFYAEERAHYDRSTSWNLLDRNLDGVLSLNEIRTLLVSMHGGEFGDDSDYDDRLQRFLECSGDKKNNNSSLLNSTFIIKEDKKSVHEFYGLNLTFSNESTNVSHNVTEEKEEYENKIEEKVEKEDEKHFNWNHFSGIGTDDKDDEKKKEDSDKDKDKDSYRYGSTDSFDWWGDDKKGKNTRSDRVHFLNTLNESNFIFLDGKFPHITVSKEKLESCQSEMDAIRNYFLKRKKRKTVILEEDPQIAFVMVDNDYSEMRKKFDGIRNSKHKFICLNDNMKHSNHESDKSIQVLNDFYESLFPLPSQYELPSGKTNIITHLNDLEKLYSEMESGIVISLVAAVFLFIIFFFILFFL